MAFLYSQLRLLHPATETEHLNSGVVVILWAPFGVGEDVRNVVHREVDFLPKQVERCLSKARPIPHDERSLPPVHVLQNRNVYHGPS